VERNGSVTLTESRVTSQLSGLHQHMKLAHTPEEAKRELKVFESSSGFGPGSEAMEAIRKAFDPALAVFASKTKESEDRYLLAKKRELMEGLVNAYRKEIPHGEIRIRAAYLNILFDTQMSLLNEDDDTEAVYVKRNKDRFDSLRGMAAESPDKGLAFRVSNLESIFNAYTKGFEAAVKWREKKAESLAKIEKGFPRLVSEVRAGGDGQIEDFRRSFLYTCVFSVILALVCFVVLFFAHKLQRLKFDQRGDALGRYLREFGRERVDPQVERDINALRADEEWAPIIQRAMESEDEFAEKYQSQLSIPRALQLPYLVFTKGHQLKLWNEAAAELFSLSGRGEVALDEIISENTLMSREGETATLVDTIRGSFGVPKMDSFELQLRRDGQWIPMELIACPVTTGPLAGGKLYLWREIRSEVERLDKATAYQLSHVRDFVHKLTHGYEVELLARESDTLPVREMICDLDAMKRKIDEREALWKSETEALGDQASRQMEILARLHQELSTIRQGQGEALDLVQSIHGIDENWHDEVCVIDRDLQRWRENRHRLISELLRHDKEIAKARSFEQKVRVAAEEIGAFLETYERDLQSLRKFAEEAKIHAVNLGFVADPALREYGSRSRAFSYEMSRFVERTESLCEKMKQLVAEHPARDLAPHLDGIELDPSLVGMMQEEQERLASFVERWKASGASLVEGGGKAVDLLRDVDKKSAVATQLGETSILINEQAQGNLARWN
jgi:hypothetical protein